MQQTKLVIFVTVIFAVCLSLYFILAMVRRVLQGRGKLLSMGSESRYEFLGFANTYHFHPNFCSACMNNCMQIASMT